MDATHTTETAMTKSEMVGKVIEALNSAPNATATAYEIGRKTGLGGDAARSILVTLTSDSVGMVKQVGRASFRLRREYLASK